MSELVYLLDSEGLSQAVRGEPRMGFRLKDAERSGIRVVTSAMTLIEAHDRRVGRAAWQWALAKIIVRPVTQAVARSAINLLSETGLHGHRHAIDAVLAAVALQEPGDVMIFTSDPDDLQLLCGGHALVVKV